MKKIVSLLIALVMVFAMFAGCGKSDKDTGSSPSSTTSPGVSSKPSAGTVDVSGTGPETNELGIMRYPASEGQNCYVAPEGWTLMTVDKEAVHPSDSATFKMACTGTPSSLCVLTDIGSQYATMPVSIFYDSLLYYDSINNEVVPCLATSWEWIDDLHIRFTLRDDVYSHLGDHFTASDVKYTFEWGCSNPKLASTWGSIYDPENFKIVDDYTIEIAMLNITPFVLYDLTRPMGYPIVVEASVEKLGGKTECGANPLMGTGPYKLKEWDQTSQTVYAERNEDYWAALPYYKYYELHTVTDTTTRCMGLEAGDYDLAQSPSSNAVIAAIDNPDITTYLQGGAATMRWDFNTDREPFNVKEVRQALAMAVNYDAIRQVAYHGYSEPADSVIPYSLEWHTSPDEGETEFYQYYDIERAKQKLVEAGYADGFDITIMFTSGLSDVTAAVEILQNGLHELKVNVKLDQYESATYNDLRNKHDYHSILGNTLNTSPASTLKQIDPRVSNWTGEGWLGENKDAIFELIDNCKFTRDLEQCYEYLDEFQDLYRELCPSVTLACGMNYNMLSGDIVNMAEDYSGNVYPAAIFPAEYILG